MQNQIQHYRVEFYGGPNDGEVIFSMTSPKQTYDLATKLRDDITGVMEVHVYRYVLNWLNEKQARYIYENVRIVE